MRRPQSIIVIAVLVGIAFGGYAIGMRMAADREQQNLRQGAASIPSAPATNNWPGLFGPLNNSTSVESGLNLDWSHAGPDVVWRQPIGTGYSSPVVWGKRLIVFHRQENEEILECFDAASGESHWRMRAPTEFRCRYRYSNGPYSTPIIDGERVYAVGAEGQFYCVELATGKTIWQRHLTREYRVKQGNFAVAASPLLEGNLLIFNLGGRQTGAGIVALDKLTGKTIWKSTGHGAGYATPRAATIFDRRIVAVLTLDGLVCIDPNDGEVLWTYPFKANHPEYANATSPLIHGDFIFVSVYQKGSFCARLQPDGRFKILWKKRRGIQSQFSTLIGVNGHAYGFDASTRTFCCIRLDDGTLKWQWPPEDTEGIGRGQAVAIENRFVLFGEYGRLASLEINSHKPILKSLSDNLLKSPCYSSPAISNGRLYVRNEREIVCFNLRSE